MKSNHLEDIHSFKYSYDTNQWPCSIRDPCDENVSYGWLALHLVGINASPASESADTAGINVTPAT